MNKLVFFLFLLLILGCSQERISKPTPLLSPEQMTNFHVDLALLNAASGYANDSIVPIDSLYAFHNIDSTTFAKNNIYYASKPKVYAKIFEAAKEQLQGLTEMDTLQGFEKPILLE